MRDLLRYLKDVLGVESIHADGEMSSIPSGGQTVSERLGVDLKPQFLEFLGEPLKDRRFSDQKCDLLFLNIVEESGSSLLQKENWELFDKMIQAMKIADKKIAIAETYWTDRDQILRSLQNDYFIGNLLILSQTPIRGVARVVGEIALFESFTPALLIQQEGLKRQAWDDLKEIKKRL